MNFKDKFKSGDIICSDHFYNGLCMIVRSHERSFIRNEFYYTCQDFVSENQYWSAYEFRPHTSKPTNWRIATDDDIVNYLSRFVQIDLGKVGFFEVKLTNNGITLDGGTDYTISLEAEELVQLSKIINERVMGGLNG